MKFTSTFVISLLAALVSAANPNAFNIPPQGFEFNAGQPTTFTWSGLQGSTVTLLLRAGNSNDLTTIATIASSLQNTGSFTWNVPSDIPQGSDYAIEIIDDQDTSVVNFTPQFVINGNPVTTTTTPATTSTAVSSSSTSAATSTATSSDTSYTSTLTSTSSLSSATSASSSESSAASTTTDTSTSTTCTESAASSTASFSSSESTSAAAEPTTTVASTLSTIGSATASTGASSAAATASGSTSVSFAATSTGSAPITTFTGAAVRPVAGGVGLLAAAAVFVVAF